MKNFCALEETGQALIEAAVSLPLMLAMLLGMAELGKVVYCGIEVTNAARAATQYAAMNGGAFSTTDASGLDTTGMLSAATGDAGNLLGNTLTIPATIPNTSLPNPSYSCACSDGSTPSCAKGTIPSCATSHVVVTVTVYTEGSFVPDVHIPGLPTSYTLQGRSIQEVLQ